MKRLFQPTILFLLVASMFALLPSSIRANAMVESVSTQFIPYHNNQLNHGGPLEAVKLFVRGLMTAAGRVNGEGPRFINKLTRLKNASKAVNNLTAEMTAAEKKAALQELRTALSAFKKVVPDNDPNKDSIFDGFRVLQGLMQLF